MDPSHYQFSWIPVLVLLLWIGWCAIRFVGSTSDRYRSATRGEREPDRARRSARIFTSAPPWRRRAFALLTAPGTTGVDHRTLAALDNEAILFAHRLGLMSPGLRERFMVACEWFYDHPRELRDDWPEMYDHLSRTLGLDPARRELVMRATQAA